MSIKATFIGSAWTIGTNAKELLNTGRYLKSVGLIGHNQIHALKLKSSGSRENI
ncbi:MAG: hypothetical protein ACTSWN_07330 [Promethearchaeota archaeon]